MIKKIILLLLFFLIFCYGFAEALQEIVALQSMKVKPYDDALKGFQYTCNCVINELCYSKSDDLDIINKIRKIKPDVVLAIGIDALSKVKNIKDLPIIYLMIPNPHSIISEQKNITGISMNIPPEKQLDIFQEVLPHAKRIGLLYDPNKTGYFIKRAYKIAPKYGIELIAKEVKSSKEVPGLIKGMQGDIEAFWMLPDTTVICSETLEFLFLLSIENKIPILTFSNKYVEIGAMLSLSIDAFDLGMQAGEMYKEIVSGKDIQDISRSDARKIVLSINLKVAKKLGITISDDILRKVKIFY